MPWLPRRRAQALTSAQDAPAESRSYSISDPALAAMFGFSPGSVTESTALTLSAVYRAIALISGSIGTLPLRTLRTNTDGTRARVASVLDNPGMDRWTPFEWKELVTVYLLLHGAAPLQHIYGGGGQLLGLVPIHPQCVGVEHAPQLPGGRKFTVRTDGDTRTFDARTMTYIPGLSVNGVQGISVLSAARQSLGVGLSGDRAAHRLMSNGAMLAGMVTPKDDDLDEAEAKTVAASIAASMTGPENAGAIPVVNRRLEFTPWTMKATDAQFLQSRHFSIDEIGRWFGLPPHLLGQMEKSTSWGQGIQEQNRGLARYTLAPWTSRIDERLGLLIPDGQIAEFDYAAFLEPAPEDEIGLLLDQVNGGLITPNEARRIRNLPPLSGALNDKLRLPAGMDSNGSAPGGAPVGSGT